jgi:hypothetical protein
MGAYFTNACANTHRLPNRHTYGLTMPTPNGVALATSAQVLAGIPPKQGIHGNYINKIINDLDIVYTIYGRSDRREDRRCADKSSYRLLRP